MSSSSFFFFDSFDFSTFEPLAESTPLPSPSPLNSFDETPYGVIRPNSFDMTPPGVIRRDSFDMTPPGVIRRDSFDETPCGVVRADSFDMTPPGVIRAPSGKRRHFTPVPADSDSSLHNNIKRRRIEDTYGAGSSNEITDWVKSKEFPSDEEKEFLLENLEMSENIFTSTKLTTRKNNAMIEFNPIRVQFKNLEGMSAIQHHVAKVLDVLIRGMIERVDGSLETTKYWIHLQHPGYKHEGGIYVNHLTYAAADGGFLSNKLSKQLQSNEELRIDDSFVIRMNIFKASKRRDLQGRGLPERGLKKSTKIRENFLKEFFGVKNQFVSGESHCLPKALIIGKVLSDINTCTDETEKKKLTNLRRHLIRKRDAREEYQVEAAKKLLREAQMDEKQEEHSVQDLTVLARHLSQYQIKVWSTDSVVVTEEASYNEGAPGFIGLFYYGKHYEPVSHTTGSNATRFCYKCRQFGNKNHYRECKAKCVECGWTDCIQGSDQIHCNKCGKIFKSQSCFDKHLLPVSGQALPHCSKYFRCNKCHEYDRTPEYRGAPHICGKTVYCPICRTKSVKKDHSCSHALPEKKQRDNRLKAQESWRAIFYDCECIVANSGSLGEMTERSEKHVPNMISCEMKCQDCMDKDECETCLPPWTYSYKDDVAAEEIEEPSGTKEGEALLEEAAEDDEEEEEEDEEEEIVRNTPLSRFAEFLLKDPLAKNSYVLAHNGGRYDHVMLIAELDRLAGCGREARFIAKGMTIMSCDFAYKKRKIFFRDTMQFLPMALSKFPKAFDLEGEAKGYFPYLYNHPENYDKILQTLPDKDYYNPQFMSQDARKDFEEWYADNYHTEFELHREMLRYCESDVRILARGFTKFMKMCMDNFKGWNPLVQGVTLASFAMFVLKNEYIKKGDVGYLPENGYGGGNNSVLAMKYVQWLEHLEPGVKFQYKLRGGEKEIRASGRVYYADAYNGARNEVVEVYGCLFHGCPKCNPRRDVKSVMKPELTVENLYQRTMEREEHLKSAGFTVKAIWECEIREEMSRNAEMKKFFKLNNYTHRLQPREALFGGRTQVFRAISNDSPTHSLQYYDFVSMYPYLNAGGAAYPRGNPKVIVDLFQPVDEIIKTRGLAYVDILPAVDTKIGILPVRVEGKLMFPSCRTCANNTNISGACTHRKVSERYLTGTWTTDEIKKAQESGYKILKYHEVLHWDDWVAGGFFKEYIRPLLKLKHEKSGWPRENMSQQEKEDHIKWIKEHDNVELDPEAIEVNNALRSLAKLFLNCAWGKFAQNPVQTETRVISSRNGEALASFFNDEKYVATALIPFGKSKYIISRKVKKECAPPSPFTHVGIAAITTASARLRLLEAIERVGFDNMIYCDTDSLIFMEKRGENPLGNLKGQQLGYLTNEIKGAGRELTSVVAMAPKVYAMKIKNADGSFTYPIKAKGISMNSGNAARITYDSMHKAMTEFLNEDESRTRLTGEMLTFKRGNNMLDGLWTSVMTRKLDAHLDKGHVTAGVVTPFGYLPTGTKLCDDYPF